MSMANYHHHVIPIFKPGMHTPGFLKLLLCGHLYVYVCVCVCVCVCALENINN